SMALVSLDQSHRQAQLRAASGDPWLVVQRISRLPRSTLFPYTTLFRSRPGGRIVPPRGRPRPRANRARPSRRPDPRCPRDLPARSEEHTSELQSHLNLVCRPLLAKKTLSTVNSICTDDLTCHSESPQTV